MRAFLLLLALLTACSDYTLGTRDELEGDDPGECEDEADNDGDGLFDCDDEDCAGANACAEGDDDDATFADDDDDAADDDDVADDDDATTDDDDSTADDDDSTADDDDSTADDDDSTADDDDATPSPGGPITSTGSGCNGTVWTYAVPTPGWPELHIISTYEGSGGHSAPPGITTITVNRTTQMTLVLSSYEPVIWDIQAAPGAQIDQVIVNGYNTHTVTGTTAPVLDRSGVANYYTACGYEWPSGTGGCDTPGLVTGAQNETGMVLDSFTGCYHGTDFELN